MMVIFCVEMYYFVLFSFQHTRRKNNVMLSSACIVHFIASSFYGVFFSTYNFF